MHLISRLIQTARQAWKSVLPRHFHIEALTNCVSQRGRPHWILQQALNLRKQTSSNPSGVERHDQPNRAPPAGSLVLLRFLGQALLIVDGLQDSCKAGGIGCDLESCRKLSPYLVKGSLARADAA